MERETEGRLWWRRDAESRLAPMVGKRPDQWSRRFEELVPFPELRLEMCLLFHKLSWVDVWGYYRPDDSIAGGLSETRRRQLWRDAEWRDWADLVTSIDVTILPNGRLRAREPDTTYSVEIRWRDYHGLPAASLIQILPDSFLAFNQGIDLDAYLWACNVELARSPQRLSRLPARGPLAGREHDPKFYRQLLDRYNALLARGHKAPVQEIANDMNANPSTVKSWLRRGRKYLLEGTE